MRFPLILLDLSWAGIIAVPRAIGSASLWLLIPLLLAASFWVGCASWAATLAEKRKQSPIRHFLLGLLVPFVYPFILATEKVRDAAAGVAAKPAAVPPASASAPRAAVAAPVPDAAAAAPASVAAVLAVQEELGFGPEYFGRLQKAGIMTPAAPCTVRFSGREIAASGILEVLPEVVVLEVRAVDGKPQRVRVPYARIEAVTEGQNAADPRNQ